MKALMIFTIVNTISAFAIGSAVTYFAYNKGKKDAAEAISKVITAAFKDTSKDTGINFTSTTFSNITEED